MLLRIENLEVKYGNVQVLHKLNLNVAQGEIVTILGANGAGKSTTLMSVSGLVKPSGGGIYLEDKALHKLEAHDIVKLGLAQVPEGRRVFGTLSVQENLHLGAFTATDQARIRKNMEWVYEMFPILHQRRGQLAGTLSGGEQQMLAIGRGLMANPKILLLDEPSLGLAPILVKSIFATIREINKSGVTIVLVEQNARLALKLADRGYVLELGKIVLEDTAKALLVNPEVQNAYLGGAG
ncbi:amino acid/amide ABC transporter ATP-binding protein 2, HAAT family [Desulfonatronum thiosulfatophilum]|uniref:Amino acid/amide ABC transporter ATP-binding protein 2, HAAT family n=1 Tax=Desulfonatronum thiosulfatophilum TaxID=617002 RepID=A0A1G6E1Y5_9BACT|nr:ABC transporter ATP-binding protein [Desulfonatronum thiosulfatophilum]SDB51434.1 amino acid/amide ABC transporter ATP-binding protein 2, HAAT family [Desulfonatronum thiosulfatophilum]